MRQNRSSASAPPSSSTATNRALQSVREEGQFGSWQEADLRALPRFPHPDSFPLAKGLINRFVLRQDGLQYRDLRIALFWLGFGLLDAPSPAEPAMNLVPLCKDLDVYSDTALELGYDPSASVHGRPFRLPGPASTASHSQSSSSSSAANGARESEALKLRGRPAGWSPEDTEEEDEEEQFKEVRHRVMHQEDSLEEEGREGLPQGPLQRSGGSASSRSLTWGDIGGLSMNREQALSLKVKLLHAGGWSSGSEGGGTPPMPPASSSGEGGLDAGHVAQFTVSFVSDQSLHEDLEETSCLCTFCLDSMKIGEELCRLPCMHTFHQRCVHAWLARDRRCMLCRLDVTRPCG